MLLGPVLVTLLSELRLPLLPLIPLLLLLLPVAEPQSMVLLMFEAE